MEGRPDYSELEEHLRDEVAWRKLLIEESRDGIVIVNKDAEVVEANRQFANMLGYSMEEIRQLHVWDWDTVFTKEQILGADVPACRVYAIKRSVILTSRMSM